MRNALATRTRERIGNRGDTRVASILLGSAIAVLCLLYLYPIARLGVSSLTNGVDDYGDIVQQLTYWKILGRTFLYAAIVAAITLVIAYPLAAQAALGPRRGAIAIIAMSTLPLWTSALVRTYAWVILLGRDGPINNALIATHIISEPLRLNHNTVGTIVGAVYVLMPLMVLALYGGMRRIDRNQLAAARSLGARPAQVFVTVVIPNSRAAMVSGFLLVYITALGLYIQPMILGGSSDVLFSALVADTLTIRADIPGSAALGIVFLVAAILVLALSSRAIGIRTLVQQGRGPTGRVDHGGGSRWVVGASRAVAATPLLCRILEWPWLRRAVIGAGLAFLILPYLVILPVSFSGSDYLSIPTSNWSTRWYDAVLDDPQWRNAFVDSLLIAAVAAIGGVVLGTLGSLGMRYALPKLASTAFTAFMVPLLVPVMIYAVAAYTVAASTGMVDTKRAIILAHAALVLPYVVILLVQTLDGIPRTLENASRSLGATLLASLRKVTLPLAIPGMVLAFGVAFQTSFDEVVTALFLSGVNTRTVPKQMWQAATKQVDPSVAAAAVIMTAIVIAVLAIAGIAASRIRKSTQA